MNVKIVACHVWKPNLANKTFIDGNDDVNVSFTRAKRVELFVNPVEFMLDIYLVSMKNNWLSRLKVIKC